MSKKTIRKIEVNGDTYSWTVASGGDVDKYDEYINRQVYIWPVSYQGRRLSARIGNRMTGCGCGCGAGADVAVKPSDVAEWIKSNIGDFVK